MTVLDLASKSLALAESFQRPLEAYRSGSVKGMTPKSEEIMIHLLATQTALLIEIARLLEAKGE
jgi:hypothetical protein